MTWGRFTLARARASIVLIVTLLALVAVTTGIIAGAVGYSQAAAITAARAALTEGDPQESAVQVRTRLAEDAQQQDEKAREIIASAFAPAPVTITHQVVSEPQRVTVGGGAEPAEQKLVLLSDAGLADAGIQVVEGRLPGDDGGDGNGDGETVPGALHAGAAGALEVGVGDELTVGDRSVEILGLWQPENPDDPAWFDDPLVRSGRDEDAGAIGPLVVDTAVTSATGSPFAQWLVLPRAEEVSPDDLPVLAAGAEALRADLSSADGLAVRGVTGEGDLAPTAGAAAQDLATARALGVVPLAVLVLVTGLALIQVARLLSTSRDTQAHLLIARGASPAQVLAAGLAESVVVALVGGLIGGAAAVLVLRLLPAGDLVTGAVLTTAAGTLVGIVLTLFVVGLLHARRLAAGGGSAPDRSGRAKAATTAASVVLVLAAAALSWWQLRRVDSLVVRAEDGSTGTDLVAAAAPALLLAAAAVVALALVGPVSRAAELATRPTRGLRTHLASAQVSRRLPVHAVPVVLTVLAVGATTVAAGYAGTSSLLREQVRTVVEGAPVRADLVRPIATVTPGLMPPPPPDLTAADGIDAATLVWHDDNARVGDLDVPLTVARTEQLEQVLSPVPGSDVTDLPDGLSVAQDADGQPLETGGVPVPAGTGEITVEVDAELLLNRWSEAQIAGWVQAVEAEREAMAEAGVDIPSTPVTEEALTRLERDRDRIGATREVEVALQLRDVATGITSTVAGAPVDVPGPEVTWTGEDPSTARSEPSRVSESVAFTLHEDREHVLEGVVVTPPVSSPGAEPAVEVDHVIDLRVLAGDEDLLAGTGEPGAWASSSLVDAAEAEELEQQAAAEDVEVSYDVQASPTQTVVYSRSNRPALPPSLDTSESTWRIRGSDADGYGNLGGESSIRPGVRPADPALADATAPGAERETIGAVIPVALTPDAARGAALSPGDEFALRYGESTLPARLAAIIPAVPGQDGTLGALADSSAVSAALTTIDRSLPWPSQSWGTTGTTGEDVGTGATDTAVASAATLDGVGAVTGPRPVSATDPGEAARLVFWVASVGAVVLALTGTAAAAVTVTSSRRPEVAVLRALGMTPGAQAGSRTLELLGVVGAAALLGIGAGFAVRQGVVADLARAAAPPDAPDLPILLRTDLPPWLMLLAVGAAVTLLMTFLLARRVHAQAMDRTYREEVR